MPLTQSIKISFSLLPHFVIPNLPSSTIGGIQLQDGSVRKCIK
jgi:hypothetical protein